MDPGRSWTYAPASRPYWPRRLLVRGYDASARGFTRVISGYCVTGSKRQGKYGPHECTVPIWNTSGDAPGVPWPMTSPGHRSNLPAQLYDNGIGCDLFRSRHRLRRIGLVQRDLRIGGGSSSSGTFTRAGIEICESASVGAYLWADIFQKFEETGGPIPP